MCIGDAAPLASVIARLHHPRLLRYSMHPAKCFRCKLVLMCILLPGSHVHKAPLCHSQSLFTLAFLRGQMMHRGPKVFGQQGSEAHLWHMRVL